MIRTWAWWPLAAFVAFLCALMPFSAYEAQGFVLAVLLAAGMLAQALVAGHAAVSARAPIAWCAGLFWLLALVSVAFSETRETAFVFFCFFSVLPMSAATIMLRGPRPDDMRLAGYVLAGLLAALAVFSIVTYVWLPSWLYNGQARWPFADPNGLAALFSLGFFAALGLMVGGDNRWQSNAGMALAVLCVIVIMMTGARAAFYALAPALAIFVLGAPLFFRRHARCAGALLAGGLIVFAVLYYHAPQGAGSPAETLFSYNAEGWLEARPSLWASTVAMFRDHPWIGTGIGTFFLHYPVYRGADYASAGFAAHSDPLQFAAEMGVLAPVLFYAFLILAAIRTVVALRALPPDSPQRIVILSPFCALGAMVAHTHVSFNLNLLPVLMLSGWMLGLWFVTTAPSSQIAMQPGRSRRLPALAVLMIAMIFAAYQTSEILVERARARLESGDMQGFAQDLNRAHVLSWGRNARAYTLAAAVPLGILSATSPTLSAQDRLALVQQGQTQLQKAIAINPHLPAPYYTRALLARAAGNGEGEADLRQALTVDPQHEPSRMLLADVLIADKKPQEALFLLEDGLRWPGASDALYQKAAFLALEQDDIPKHKALMQAMLRRHKHRKPPVRDSLR